MSCPTEASCLLFAESALEGDALRSLEAHLVTCRDCRTLVVALREEGALLGEVLREQVPAAPAPVASPAPQPGVALGLPLAIAAVTAALAVTSSLVESRLPGALDLLHPRRLKGAAEMAFDLVFLLRENAPGLLELALSVGVMASVSALLSFAVSSFSRRLFGGAALLCLAVIATSQPASGFETRRGESLRVASDERIEQSVLASVDRIDVDGVIEGDLIAAAERISVRGEVTGSLYVFAGDLEISGRVGGAVHAITESSRVEGTVGGGIYLASEDFTLASGGRALQDVNVAAEAAVFDGQIGRDLYLIGDRLDLRSAVGRHVNAFGLDELQLRDGAHVGGDLDARMEAGREIERAPGARVDGEVRVEPRPTRREHYLDHYRSWRFYALNLLWFAAAFVFGLITHRIGPVIFRGSIVTGADFARTLGLGFVVAVVSPLAIVAAALTIVGIPAAVLGLFLYIVALYTADLVVGAWLGRVLLPPSDDSTLAFGRSFGVGLAIVSAVAMVPFVGPAFGIVAFLLGLGLLASRGYEALR